MGPSELLCSDEQLAGVQSSNQAALDALRAPLARLEQLDPDSVILRDRYPNNLLILENRAAASGAPLKPEYLELMNNSGQWGSLVGFKLSPIPIKPNQWMRAELLRGWLSRCVELVEALDHHGFEFHAEPQNSFNDWYWHRPQAELLPQAATLKGDLRLNSPKAGPAERQWLQDAFALGANRLVNVISEGRSFKAVAVAGYRDQQLVLTAPAQVTRWLAPFISKASQTIVLRENGVQLVSSRDLRVSNSVQNQQVFEPWAWRMP